MNEEEVGRPWRQRAFPWAYDFTSYGTYLSGRGFIVVMAVVVVVVLAGCIGTAMPLTFVNDRYECQQLRANAGVETMFVNKFPLTWGCFVRVDDQWVPYDKWIANSGN